MIYRVDFRSSEGEQVYRTVGYIVGTPEQVMHYLKELGFFALDHVCTETTDAQGWKTKNWQWVRRELSIKDLPTTIAPNGIEYGYARHIYGGKKAGEHKLSLVEHVPLIVEL